MMNSMLRGALAAVITVTLAGCMDSEPLEPTLACNLNPTPAVVVAGDTVVATNGLKVIELSTGTGNQVQASSATTVCFVGFFPNGQVFDQGSFQFVPSDGQVITGFAQGVVGMQVGATRRVIVPPALGFGSTPRTDVNGNVVIPANSTLVFDIGVLQVR